MNKHTQKVVFSEAYENLSLGKNRDTFAIGDVHGCYLTMMKLIEVMGVKSTDVLIQTGDAVDRGPRIKETLDYLLNRLNTFITRGNHDVHFSNYVLEAKESSQFMLKQGLQETLDQLGDEAESYARRLNEHVFVVKMLPNYVLCHSTWNWHEGEEFSFRHIWHRWMDDRPEKHYASYTGPIIVHGHTPVYAGSNPLDVVDGRIVGINLDGGCIDKDNRKACLRGLRLSDGQVFEVLNID